MVARFVLDEVQGFADATDDVKRRRARRGLETLDALRAGGERARSSCSTTRCPRSTRSTRKLIALARRLQLRLLTNDGPLARNAELQGVPTTNLRKLAQELTPSIGPGDFVRVALDPRRQGDGPGRRSSRRRLDGRRERRPRARRRSRGDAPGDVGRADRRRAPALRPPRRRLTHVRLGRDWARLARCRPGRSSSRRAVARASVRPKQFARLGDVERARPGRRRRARVVRRRRRRAARRRATGPRRPACGVATGGATRSASVRAGLALRARRRRRRGRARRGAPARVARGCSPA